MMILRKKVIASLLVMSGGYSMSTSAYEVFDVNSPWAFGDWGGKRKALSNDGINVGLQYINETAANIVGGYDTSTDVGTSDQTMLLFSDDLSKMTDVDGQFTVILTNRNNHRLITTERLNDPRSGTLPNLTQEVWGYGSVNRITRLTYTQGIADRMFLLTFGKMTPTADFFPSYPEFQSLLNSGTVPGISPVWYGWPIGSWGAHVTWNITPEVYVRSGVFQQNPELTKNDKGMSLTFSGSQGEIYPVLLGWHPHWGANKLAGNYFIGAFYSNVTADDVYEGVNGSAEALNPAAGYKKHNNKKAAWIYLDQQLTGPGRESKKGLKAFINGEINDKSTSVLLYAYGAGLYYTGLFENRPDDVIGVASTYIKINDRWSENRSIYNDASGVTDFADSHYLPPGSGELSAELFYRIKATGWLTFQPNIQYYHSPGAVNSVPDAWVVGLQTKIDF
ncbi:TPA: carbohydrate porin [Raoultella planticola]|uniref:carbohydrate porin n=1 Tax=Raoultella planticola TaxID=575 RepID=UPI001A2C317E|nr:carbohydrate porin [Raoultella planticola]HAT1623132.1 carbohydrate porin [Raoultella planticola]